MSSPSPPGNDNARDSSNNNNNDEEGRESLQNPFSTSSDINSSSFSSAIEFSRSFDECNSAINNTNNNSNNNATTATTTVNTTANKKMNPKKLCIARSLSAGEMATSTFGVIEIKNSNRRRLSATADNDNNHNNNNIDSNSNSNSNSGNSGSPTAQAQAYAQIKNGNVEGVLDIINNNGGDTAAAVVAANAVAAADIDSATIDTTEQQQQQQLYQEGVGVSSSTSEDATDADVEGSGDSEDIECEYDEGEEYEYEEEDSEVFLAQEMALAIAKNPTMTPDQLRELQHRMQEDVEERKKNKDHKKKSSRKKVKKKKRKSKSSSSTASHSISWGTHSISAAELASSFGGTTSTSLKSTMTFTTKDVKDTYKETKHIAKANAKVIKKEFKKGLRAMGLMNESQTKVGIMQTTAISSADEGGGGGHHHRRSGSVSSVEISTGVYGDVQSSSPQKAPLGDKIGSKFGNITGSMTSGTDGITSNNHNNNSDIRLDSIVWKRRSGLGKYSTSSPWEKRRIILQGTKLIYYKTLSESQHGDQDTGDDENEHDASAQQGWINHFNTTILDKKIPGITIPWDGHGGGSSNVGIARGYLDVRKERASIAASYGHTGAPTPFALSIKVASISKWKLCFTTQSELMSWLAALSDVVVEGSVDAYNSEILVANDPSSAAAAVAAVVGLSSMTGHIPGVTDSTTTGGGGLTWQEPPEEEGDDGSNAVGGGVGDTTTTTTTTASASASASGGHRLWSTGRYLVKSACHPDIYTKSSNDEDVDQAEDDNDDDDYFVGGCAEDYVIDTTPTTTTTTIHKNYSDKKREIGGSGSGTCYSYCGIPTKYTMKVLYVMNIIILLSRAQSTLSNEQFWYLLVFFNVGLVMLVDKVPVGGTITLKPGLRQQQLRSRNNNNKKRRCNDSDGGGTTATTKKGQQSSLVSSTTTPGVGVIGATVVSDEDDDADDTNFVPVAGSTSIRIENPTDLPTKDGIIFAGWREADPASLQVRSYGYKTHGKKIPCPGDLYRCVDVDIFESRTRVPDIASRVILPKVSFQGEGGDNNSDNFGQPKTWNAPDLFVITVALPTDPPKLYGATDNNGGGYTIALYLVMRQETRDILRRITANGYHRSMDDEQNNSSESSDAPNEDDQEKKNQSKVNAVRLFDEWCRRAPSDDTYMAKFKVIPQGNNLAEIGLPAWISKYNGKPFLIKRPGQTGFLYRHPEQSCLEFDVSLHPFPYLAKQGICYMKGDYFKHILATLAFCIEGTGDEELPECLIGCFQLCYPDPANAIQGEEFFAGKSARTK